MLNLILDKKNVDKVKKRYGFRDLSKVYNLMPAWNFEVLFLDIENGDKISEYIKSIKMPLFYLGGSFEFVGGRNFYIFENFNMDSFDIEFYNDSDMFVYNFLLKWFNDIYDLHLLVFKKYKDFTKKMILKVFDIEDVKILEMAVDGCFPVFDESFSLNFDYSSVDYLSEIKVKFAINGRIEITTKSDINLDLMKLSEENISTFEKYEEMTKKFGKF